MIAAVSAAAEPPAWVEASGLVTAPVRYVNVVAALGQPSTSRITPESAGGHRKQGGDHQSGDRDRELTTLLANANRRLADSPVDSMLVRAPFIAATPRGLRAGLPRDAAPRRLELQCRFEQCHHVGSGSALSRVDVVARRSSARRATGSTSTAARSPAGASRL